MLSGIEACNGKNVEEAHHQCARDFRTYAESGDLDPREFKTHDGHGRDDGTIVYGQMIAALRDEESMIIEILKTANGPNVLGTTASVGDIPDVPRLNGVPQWPSQCDKVALAKLFGSPETIAANRSQYIVQAYSPYPIIFGGKEVNSIPCNRAVKNELEQIFKEVLAHYGLENIKRLKLNVMGPNSAYRPGNKKMHGYGIAFDWNPSQNPMRFKPNASPPQSYKDGPLTNDPGASKAWAPFWHIWENHGAQSLGRLNNDDWMHVQFATWPVYPGSAGKKQDALFGTSNSRT